MDAMDALAEIRDRRHRRPLTRIEEHEEEEPENNSTDYQLREPSNDGRRRRRRSTVRDPMGREVETVEESDAMRAVETVATYDGLGHLTIDQAHMHRPGFRLTDRSASERAYAEMKDAIQTEYLGDARRVPEMNSRAENSFSDAQRPHGMSDAEFEYRRYCAELADAWRPRPRDAALDPHEGVQAPKGIPPGGGVSKHIGIEAGQSCTINGFPGTYQEGEDGYLYCRPHRVPPTRADAVPRTMDAASAQAIKDQAWNEYVAHISSAWKTA
jgi:hypothetical protein